MYFRDLSTQDLEQFAGVVRGLSGNVFIVGVEVADQYHQIVRIRSVSRVSDGSLAEL